MVLQISSTPSRQTDWEKSAALFNVLRDDPTDIAAFVEHCSADDLHCLNRVHGIPGEVEIFDAILHHPLCDRATALQIFDSCNPYYYEQELAKGVTLDTYDEEEDQVFIAIIDMAHTQLANRPDWRGKFDCPALRSWDQYPHSSPAHFKNWTLPQTALQPTDERMPRADITYQFSSIRLTYNAWTSRQ